MPVWTARYAPVGGTLGQSEIALVVTGQAGNVARHRRQVRMQIVALRRMVGCGMAVHAALMREYPRRLGEKRPRALLLVRQAGEGRRRTQSLTVGDLCRGVQGEGHAGHHDEE